MPAYDVRHSGVIASLVGTIGNAPLLDQNPLQIRGFGGPLSPFGDTLFIASPILEIRRAPVRLRAKRNFGEKMHHLAEREQRHAVRADLITLEAACALAFHHIYNCDPEGLFLTNTREARDAR